MMELFRNLSILRVSITVRYWIFYFVIFRITKSYLEPQDGTIREKGEQSESIW
jgi:hypothetical protein